MNEKPPLELIMRPGVDPSSAPNKPPLPPRDYDCRQESGLVIERNLPVRLRDGVTIYLDLYRPRGAAGERDLPALLAWGPYGKHALTNRVFWPVSGVDPDWLSPLTPFEGPDPVFWGAAGYAVAVADPRGAWLSEGEFHHNGPVEAEDCRETIEWLAAQSWSNGKVGMTGVSYLACIQYYVAPLKPEPLAALNPCEGFSDWYREFACHGGIPETDFLPRASDNIRYSTTRTEDTWANAQAHPLMDAYWRSKEPALEAIETPAYVIASWADQGLHTRGTLEAFRRISSAEKWLEAHGQKKWAYYYRPETRERQRVFFDHFLKSKNTAVSGWPRVRFEVRECAGKSKVREANEWPLADVEARTLWLDAKTGRLSDAKPVEEASVAYDACKGSAAFDYQFSTDAELTGSMKLTLWFEAAGARDADLFVAVQKLDDKGAPVGFTFYSFFENGPVALGWLRASHRALDRARSTPLQPVHLHDREEPLPEGSPVPLDIEIWPSSTLFRAGETLRVIIQGSDIYKEGSPGLPFALHEQTRNEGTHIIHAGGAHDSRLLMPVASQGRNR
jgi:predicted acyl esterase